MYRPWVWRLVCGLIVVVALTATSVAAQATYSVQLVPVATMPVRVTFTTTGAAPFVNNTQWALSSTSCAGGVAPTQLATSYAFWTVNDAALFYVAEFAVSQATPAEVTSAYFCESRDAGATWSANLNAKSRANFHLWLKIPTAYTAPVVATSGTSLRVYVKNHYGRAPAARAVLVAAQSECDAATPTTISGGASVTGVDNATLAATVFTFTPVVGSTTAVFICTATSTSPADWTLTPYDPNDDMVYRAWNYYNKPDPSDPVTQRLSSLSFNVYPAIAASRTATIVCNPTQLIAGMSSRCTVTMQSAEALPVAAADFAFRWIKDGAGVPDCPFPTVVYSSTSSVYFDWTPQRWGRAGSVAMTFRSNPLVFVTNSNNDQAVVGTTRWPVPSDSTVSYFFVWPEYTTVYDYSAAANLMSIAGFSASAATWNTTTGLPPYSGATYYGGETSVITLNTGVTTATVTQTASVATTPSKCRFNMRYAFFPTVIDDTQTSLIGTLLVQGRMSGTVVATIRTLNIYAQGPRIVVTGTQGPTWTSDGDAYMQEQVGFEFLFDTTAWNQISLSATVDHTQQQTVYMFDPQLRCTGSGANTLPAAQVTALRAIYTNNGGTAAKFARWRNTGDTAFNGDPCQNQWMGIICRHQQVVELRLPGLNLTGSVSAATIAAFPQLEVLHLSDNTLSGAFPDLSTMPRLRTIDISNNRFSSVNAALLSATNNLCVTALFAHKNAIAAVPTQMFSHPALRVLNLGWNSMTGTLPTTWPSASILVQLTLSHNALSGALPTTLPNATLVILDLNGNKLTGTIPTGWGILQNIEFVDLSHNLLSGAVPLELSQIRSGRKLVFSAEDNYFTGVLPRLPFARYDLRMNTFACPLPTEATFSLLQQNIAVLDQDCDWSQ